jgi:hypothetical protein
MSGILQIVAIGGFLLALLGVALIFSVNTRGSARTGGVFLAIFGVVVGIAAFIASQGLLTVPVTQKAVIANTLTGSLERPASRLLSPVYNKRFCTPPITKRIT